MLRSMVARLLPAAEVDLRCKLRVSARACSAASPVAVESGSTRHAVSRSRVALQVRMAVSSLAQKPSAPQENSIWPIESYCAGESPRHVCTAGIFAVPRIYKEISCCQILQGLIPCPKSKECSKKKCQAHGSGLFPAVIESRHPSTNVQGWGIANKRLDRHSVIARVFCDFRLRPFDRPLDDVTTQGGRENIFTIPNIKRSQRWQIKTLPGLPPDQLN